MKKRMLCLLLALSFLCTACGKTEDTPALSDTQTVLTDATPLLSGGEVRNAEAFDLTEEMVAPMLTLMHAYYRSVGTLRLQPCREIFTTRAESKWHSAVWRSLIEIRKASLIDLHLNSYYFTLTVEDVVRHSEDYVELTVSEDAVYRFTATADIDTEQYDVLHTFLLQRSGDIWLIDGHNSDDNPYYNFDYDRFAGRDSRLNDFLQNIAARQAQQGAADSAATRTWDHDYDRDSAYQYMQTYIQQRNDTWAAYDTEGGNCQNFGSQVLFAGGIPMDEEGDAQWFWHDRVYLDLSWINVGHFMDYAQNNSGFGLVAEADAGYYTGQVGDILILGAEGMNHTTVITGLITDEDGKTADYLLCSNTSNYRNFPASAYYYTKHWLVRILGWNE